MQPFLLFTAAHRCDVTIGGFIPDIVGYYFPKETKGEDMSTTRPISLDRNPHCIARPSWWRHFLFSLCLAGMAQTAAASAPPPDAPLPPELVSTMRCDGMRTIFTFSLVNDLSPRRHDGPIRYSVQQVREINTELDAIIDELCVSINSPTGQRLLPSKLSVADKASWDVLLATEKGRQWMRLNSALLAEISPLADYFRLAIKLHPPTPGPDTPYSAAEQRRITDEIAQVSFTDEQKEARALLVFVGTDPRFLQILPARFDIDRLRRIEEKTRAIGIALLKTSTLRLKTDSSHMVAIASDPKEGAVLKAAEARAKQRIGKLVDRYLPRP